MKLLCVVALAMAITASAVGTANASRSIGTNDTTQNWRGRLTFADEGNNFRVVCEVLREYIFHASSHAKTEGALVGFANARIVGGCSGGRVVVLGREYHVRYIGFEGRLPTPRVRYRLDYSNGGFLVSAFFEIARCLYSGTGDGITNGVRPITSIRVDESVVNRPAFEELSGISCPSGRISGELFPLEETYNLSLL